MEITTITLNSHNLAQICIELKYTQIKFILIPIDGDHTYLSSVAKITLTFRPWVSVYVPKQSIINKGKLF